MFESRNRLFGPALVVLAGIALGGCSPTQDGDPSPPPPTEDFKALFNPTTGALPHPTDLFFSGSTDGTLNLPTIAFRPASMQAALNALDGWSTSATMSTGFSMPIQPGTLSATSVRVVEMYFSNTTKAPAQGAELPPGVTSPVRRILTFGTDYTATVSDDVDSGGKFARITPLKPLTPSTGATNIGYLVILTNGIQEPNGKLAQPDDFYAAIKAAPADCSNFTNATQNGICRLTKAHLSVAAAIGTPAANVVLTWSFTTQSVDDTFNVLALTATPQPTIVVPTGLTTQMVNPAFAGKANIYVGSTRVPYYLTPAASPTDRTSVLTKFWTAAGPSPVPGLDPTSRNLTRFNPLPAKVADQTIPLLVTVPNATAAGGACVKPATGWPVAIVQHGITGNRTQALTMADSFADACFVVAAIDLPLHGLVNTTSPLYCSATNPACVGARERTFDVDFVNNTTGAAVSDGIIDSSGAHFINLPSPLTGRDNLRQGEADLITLAKSIGTLDIDGGGADIDPTRVSFVGLSLGAISGATHAAVFRRHSHGDAFGAGRLDHAAARGVADLRTKHHRGRRRVGPGEQLVPVQPVLPRLPGGHRCGRPDQPHQGRAERATRPPRQGPGRHGDPEQRDGPAHHSRGPAQGEHGGTQCCGSRYGRVRHVHQGDRTAPCSTRRPAWPRRSRCRGRPSCSRPRPCSPVARSWW